MTHRLLSFPGSRRFGPRLRRLVLILAAAAPLSGVAVALFLDVRRPDGGLVSADGAGAYRRRPGRQLAFGTGQPSEEGLVVVNANGSGRDRDPSGRRWICLAG